MYKIAKLKEEERRILFRNTAQKMGMHKAIPGTIKLTPPAFRLEELRKDYLSMQEMMYGSFPDFNDLMSFIAELENEINSLDVF